MEGVARLRLSNDIEFEEETFLDMMKTAKEVTMPRSGLIQQPFLKNMSLHCKFAMRTRCCINWSLREELHCRKEQS